MSFANFSRYRDDAFLSQLEKGSTNDTHHGRPGFSKHILPDPIRSRGYVNFSDETVSLPHA